MHLDHLPLQKAHSFIAERTFPLRFLLFSSQFTVLYCFGLLFFGSNTSNQYQSAYRKFHSTETALLKIHSDILASMDAGKVTTLTLLDLSAAFDTIDHIILLSRLNDWFGLTRKALNWFESYLTGRCQKLMLSDCLSSKADLKFGSPSGVRFGSSAFHVLYHSIEQHDL